MAKTAAAATKRRSWQGIALAFAAVVLVGAGLAHADGLNATLEKALAGDAAAQSQVGVMFYNGDSLPQDRTRAAKWFRKSAEQGNADGQYNLGMLLIEDQTAGSTPSEGLDWLNKSALQGNDQAQYALGLMTGLGLSGATADDELSYAWLSQAAEHGNLPATMILQEMNDTMSSDQLDTAWQLEQSIVAGAYIPVPTALPGVDAALAPK